MDKFTGTVAAMIVLISAYLVYGVALSIILPLMLLAVILYVIKGEDSPSANAMGKVAGVMTNLTNMESMDADHGRAIYRQRMFGALEPRTEIEFPRSTKYPPPMYKRDDAYYGRMFGHYESPRF